MYISQGAAKPDSTVLAVIVVLTLLPLYYGSWQYRIAHPAKHEVAKHHTPVWSDAFVEEWIDTRVVEPFDPWPLLAYCNETTWQPDLVFNLDDANGGIGNVRGNVLDFLLYAIEAGASIMLPSRASRSQDDLFNVWADRKQFDTFFDEDWFLWSMEQACPQMAIYKPQAEHAMVPPLSGRYQPPSRRVDADATQTSDAYLQHVDTWLSGQSDFKPEELNVVNVGRTLWEFDTRSLPLGLRRSLGQVLRTTPQVRRLAAVIVQSLAKRHLLHIDPLQAIPKQAFLGAHLRTEADAAQAGWLNAPYTNFSAQTSAYMDKAVANKLKVMYIASGDVTELERFKEKAARHTPPLNVTSKMELLEGPDLQELESLTWDQKALVDYEILQRSSVFGGFVRSSFSYNIALTRHQWLEDRGRAIDPWLVMHSEEGVAFDDGISRIIGRDEVHEQRIPRGMWP